MNIPSSAKLAFQAAQAKAFQDRTISWYSQNTTTGTRGDKVVAPATTADYTFTDCNVQVVSDVAELDAWGIKAGRDIRIVRSAYLPSNVGDFVLYNSQYYRVKGVTLNDLYYVAYCELWQK
jgi:hypothetical protein